jgi:hypothetical protein
MATEFVMVETRWSKPLEEAIAAARGPDARLEVHKPLAGNRDFFTGKSLAELANEQGVGPVMDIGVFAGGIPDDEDVDDLLAQLEAMRGS